MPDVDEPAIVLLVVEVVVEAWLDSGPEQAYNRPLAATRTASAPVRTPAQLVIVYHYPTFGRYYPVTHYDRLPTPGG